VGRAGPAPLMARGRLALSGPGGTGSAHGLLNLSQFFSFFFHLSASLGCPNQANFVAGQTRSPHRSSWHRRPKVAGLLFSMIYRAWLPGLARLRALSHSCPARCARARHRVVIAEKVPRSRRRRREARAPKLPWTSDMSWDMSTGSIHTEQADGLVQSLRSPGVRHNPPARACL
jgi:hypothetical protein